MKGISNLVSTILILMITVILVGLSYVWFTSIFQSISESAGETVTGSSTAIATNFKIEAATNTTATTVATAIRNTGTQNINMTKISAYVSDSLQTTQGNTGILVPGNVSVFNVTNVNNPCGKILRITIETGISDTISITC